jgi:nicotinamidase-related amidase
MTDRPVLDPSRTALLVMDYQEGIVSRLPDTDALLGRITSVIDNTRAHGGHVGWVRVALDDADFAAVPESSIFAAMASGERRAQMHADAPGTQIDSRLSPQAGDIAVRKRRVGAFTTTDLDQQLRGLSVDTVVLVGISTSGVVLSTVREAMDRDYRIVVLHDACADGDPDTHTFLTTKLFPRHAYVTGVDDLEALWA